MQEEKQHTVKKMHCGVEGQRYGIPEGTACVTASCDTQVTWKCDLRPVTATCELKLRPASCYLRPVSRNCHLKPVSFHILVEISTYFDLRPASCYLWVKPKFENSQVAGHSVYSQVAGSRMQVPVLTHRSQSQVAGRSFRSPVSRRTQLHTLSLQEFHRYALCTCCMQWLTNLGGALNHHLVIANDQYLFQNCLSPTL